MSEIDTMPAGREMDVLVAQKVMGWTGPLVWIDDEFGRDPYLFEPTADPEHVASNNRDWDCRVPNYSTEIDEALAIVSALVERGIALEVSRDIDPPLAICRAALHAVEATDA